MLGMNLGLVGGDSDRTVAVVFAAGILPSFLRYTEMSFLAYATYDPAIERTITAKESPR